MDPIDWLKKALRKNNADGNLALGKIHPNRAGYVVAADGYRLHAVGIDGRMIVPDHLRLTEAERYPASAEEILYSSDHFEFIVAFDPRFMIDALRGLSHSDTVALYGEMENGLVRKIKLTTRGIGEGDRIAIIMPKSPEDNAKRMRVASVRMLNEDLLVKEPMPLPQFDLGDRVVIPPDCKVGVVRETQVTFRHDRPPYYIYLVDYGDGHQQFTETAERIESE